MINLLILFPLLFELPKSLGYFHSLDDKIYISKRVQSCFLTPWALLYLTSLLFWEGKFNLFLLESDESGTASANKAWWKGQCESWDWARWSSLACFHLVHHSAFHVKSWAPLGPCHGKATHGHLQPSNQFTQVSDILMKGLNMNLDWPCPLPKILIHGTVKLVFFKTAKFGAILSHYYRTRTIPLITVPPLGQNLSGKPCSFNSSNST